MNSLKSTESERVVVCVAQSSPCPLIRSRTLAMPWCHWYSVQKKSPQTKFHFLSVLPKMNKSSKCRGGKKNVYEFFKNIWQSLQGIILKKKKKPAWFPLLLIYSHDLGLTLPLEAERRVHMCVIYSRPGGWTRHLSTLEREENPMSGNGAKALSPHPPWAGLPQRTRRLPRPDKGQAFPHRWNSLVWSHEAKRTSDFQTPTTEFSENMERENLGWGLRSVSGLHEIKVCSTGHWAESWVRQPVAWSEECVSNIYIQVLYQHPYAPLPGHIHTGGSQYIHLPP